MEKKRLVEKYADYAKAVSRLKEVLEAGTDVDFVYDAAIQRFEFTYELGWKLLKAYLAYNGIEEVNTPREAFKEAFATGLIDDGELWIEMIKDRNLTSHTYNETVAISIYNRVKERYFGLFEKLEKELAGEINS
ncbi:MAG: nucleotidyltransferase substrate binding protein [Thermincolia bacterium]